MAIYLDSNAMFGWRTFAELDRLALTILASELGQEIVVPTLVADELEGQMRRELEAAASRFEDAAAKVEELFALDYVMTEPALDISGPLARWRAALEDAFSRCDVTAEDAMVGLRREIDGLPPARRTDPKKPGVGGRDTAIWLAVARDHARRQEPGYFISRDGGFWSGDRMNPRLAHDFDAGVDPLMLHRTVEDFLMRLGERDAVDLDPCDVQMRALPLIKSGLEESPVLPRAVFEDAFDTLAFRTEVTDGSVNRIERAQLFRGEFGEILLVDATWNLEFRLLYKEPPSLAQSQWFVLDRLDAAGRVQVYLGPAKSGADAGLFIAAQLKPRQTVTLNGVDLMVWSSSQD